ncbi:DUF819 family protein [Bacteroidota bacterium]
MKDIILIVFYFGFPALILFLERKYPILRKIGPVVICYTIGLLVGNTGLLWEGVTEYQDMVTTITIPLAIPLLLFSLNFRRWIKMAGKTFLSMILGLVSVIIMVIPGYFLFRNQLPEMWKITGMAVGLYSGGTPNLASIKLALDVDPDIYLLTHTYDLITGAILLLILMTFGQRFFLLFMRPYKSVSDNGNSQDPEKQFEQYQSYDGFFKKDTLIPLLGTLFLAIGIFGIAGGLSLLVDESAQMVVVILSITTLGIIASLIPRVNRIKKSFQLGMYLILVFCVVVSSMADISMFANVNAPLLIFVVMCVYGSLLVHALLSVIFKVDADNMIIISVALSMSPPFVPVIAAALKNREIILSGLFVGIIGYAMGNYLGILVAYLFQ